MPDDDPRLFLFRNCVFSCVPQPRQGGTYLVHVSYLSGSLGPAEDLPEDAEPYSSPNVLTVPLARVSEKLGAPTPKGVCGLARHLCDPARQQAIPRPLTKKPSARQVSCLLAGNRHDATYARSQNPGGRVVVLLEIESIL
jgi:hypothetical protein